MNWLGLAAGLIVGAGAERLATRHLRPGESVAPEVDEAELHHHHLTTADGGVLHVVEVGSGPPLVLLHGVTLRADVWHHQRVLADEARVLSVDLLGHGESVSGTDGPSIEAGADALAGLLVTLDLEGAVIVGHSMGGMILGRFLVDHPELVRSRVAGVGFVASAGRNPGGRPIRFLKPMAGQLRRVAERYPKLLRTVANIPPNDLGQILVRSTFGRAPDSSDVREIVAAFESMGIEELLSIAPSLIDHDVLEELGSVSIPAAVIVGSRDALTPPAESRLLASRLQDATLEIVPDAGHQLMLERPDEVNEMLRALLARASVSRLNQ